MDNFFCTKNLDLSKILHNIGDAICVIDNNLIYVSVNQRYADFFKLSPEHLIGRYVYDIYPNFKNSVFFEAANHTKTTGEPATRIGFSNISQKSMVVRTFRFDDNHSVMCIHYLNTVHDKQCYVGNYDGLTSLYNRFVFEADIDKAYLVNDRFGVVIIDINKFKEINESFSYEVGDMCLMETAARLKQALPKRKIYRFGSDQFAIIFEDIIEVCKLEIEQIFNTFLTPFTLKGEQFNLSFSVGFNYITEFNITTADIISNTEFALLNSKKTENNYFVYDEKSSRNTQKFQLIKELKHAIDNKELEVFYQPQIDSITHKVCGAEALIRWRHPVKGLIPPFNFLPLAEEYGLIEEIDRVVLIKAVSDIKTFCKNNIPLSLSVNFSSKTICSSKTLALVENLLSQTNINPNLLTIEITETSLMEDLSKSKEAIAQLSKLGIKIAIDDFGTGYSSMGYLMRYPTDYLKIDREFIKDIDSQEALQIITNNLIKLGHSLSMTVVAEGVENEKELQIIKDFGCDIIQGFYFSKPLPFIEFINFVQKTGFSPLKSIIV